MPAMTAERPDWDRLYRVAAAQRGLFTTRQAERAGYSPQLLNHHARAGRIRRLRRGVFRLVHFPHSDEEPLVELWLWADRKAVFSHETALSLHELSDVLPHKAHLTLPAAWVRRRLRVPEGVVLHHAPVSRGDQAWIGVLPVTAPERTIRDCIGAHVSPELVAQAISQARARGLVPRDRLAEFARAAGLASSERPEVPRGLSGRRGSSAR